MKEATETAAKERQMQIQQQMEEFAKARQAQEAVINSLKEENDRIKAEQFRKDRMDFINNKAKDLGIPQYRIEEGFAGIGENSSDDEIVAALSTVAKNVKANQLPDRGTPSVLSGGEPTKDEISSLAKALTKN